MSARPGAQPLHVVCPETGRPSRLKRRADPLAQPRGALPAGRALLRVFYPLKVSASFRTQTPFLFYFHAARRLVGSSNTRVLPVAALLSACFLIVIDTLVRPQSGRVELEGRDIFSLRMRAA